MRSAKRITSVFCFLCVCLYNESGFTRVCVYCLRYHEEEHGYDSVEPFALSVRLGAGGGSMVGGLYIGDFTWCHRWGCWWLDRAVFVGNGVRVS